MTRVYIDTGVGTRLIGNFEDGVFISKRQASKHLYKKLNAWGIDSKALNGLINDKQLKQVIIIDTETNIRYITDASNFKKFGTTLNHKPHRTQIFLPLEHWVAEG